MLVDAQVLDELQHKINTDAQVISKAPFNLFLYIYHTSPKI